MPVLADKVQGATSSPGLLDCLRTLEFASTVPTSAMARTTVGMALTSATVLEGGHATSETFMS